MRITIDKSIIDKYGLTPAEALYLLFLNQLTAQEQEEDVIKKLKAKLYVGTFEDKKKFLTVSGADMLSRLILDTKALDMNIPADQDLMDIVVAMQQEYPAGMKPERTPYGVKPSNTAWRGNKTELVERLKKFFARYGNHYTKEQLVDATKRYVATFKGKDTTFMRVLPYFIMKRERKMDSDGITTIEEVSVLANYLESTTEQAETKVEEKGSSWLEETL